MMSNGENSYFLEKVSQRHELLENPRELAQFLKSPASMELLFSVILAFDKKTHFMRFLSDAKNLVMQKQIDALKHGMVEVQEKLDEIDSLKKDVAILKANNSVKHLGYSILKIWENEHDEWWDED